MEVEEKNKPPPHQRADDSMAGRIPHSNMHRGERRRTPGRGPSLRLNPPCSLPRSPTFPLSRPRSPLSSRPQFPRRHARDLLSGRPESLRFVTSAPAQLKTLDSVSEENSGATPLVFQPHGMTAPRARGPPTTTPTVFPTATPTTPHPPRPQSVKRAHSLPLRRLPESRVFRWVSHGVN